MPSHRAISVTLPEEMANMIEAKVASGEYANESEVVTEGLRALKARDAAGERWLRDEATASWDEYQAYPSIAISAEDVSARLDARLNERERSAFGSEARRQSLLIAEVARDPDTDEAAVMREIEDELADANFWKEGGP